MKTIKVYTPAELKRKNSDGFERALEEFRTSQDEIYWSGEIIDSLKAIFKYTDGIVLRDYSIDGYYPNMSYVKFEFNQDEAGDLTGNRALAWLENNLFSNLRECRTFINRVKKYEHWYDFTKHGEIPSCPFTGVCFDEDFIESLLKNIKAGDTLHDAFSDLAMVAGKLFELEIAYQNSEENFLEQDYLFTIDGHII